MLETDIKVEPEFKIKLKRGDMPETKKITKITLDSEVTQQEQSGQKEKNPEILKIEKKKIKSKSTRRKPQKSSGSSRIRGITKKSSNGSRSSKSEKTLKINNNWVLCWTKVENSIQCNDSIWIKRWVKISEGDELSKKKNELKKKIPKIFKCSNLNCQKIFWDENKLKKHMVVHGEKQFVCEYEKCGKSFLDKSKLKRHRLVHTKERHYKCEICSKRFSLDFNLKTHIRTHTGLKPFACEFPNCNRRFTQSSNLAAHQKIHYKIGGKVRKSRKKKKK